MADWTTVTFSLLPEQKKLLEEWAQADDRSVSYILRQLIAREQVRRAGQEDQGALMHRSGAKPLFDLVKEEGKT
jgi:hypothetical protein